jgi:hypothetical protein
VHFPSAFEAELDVPNCNGLHEEVGEALPGSEALANFGVGLADPGKEEDVCADARDIDFTK